MNHSQTNSISQLPLSWARTNTADPVFKLVKLPFTSLGWIPTAEIQHHYSFVGHQAVHDIHCDALTLIREASTGANLCHSGCVTKTGDKIGNVSQR